MTQESFRQRLGRILAGTPVQQEPTPQTQIVGGGNIGKTDFERLGYNSPDKLHYDNVRNWRKIYRRGGPAATCVDAYPLFTLSNEFEFTCEEGDEALKDQVIAWTDQPHVNLNAIMWQGVLDAILCGTAFQEIVPDKGGGLWGIIPRDASSFRIKYDDYGRVLAYEQIVSDNQVTRVVKTIDKDRILALTIFPVPGEMYGASFIERAYDDIMRDCDMIESVCTGVHRHGTAKNHVRCGQPNEPASEVDLKKVKGLYDAVGAKNDWITTADVEILSVDTALAPLEQYPNMTLQRLAAAFGVPDELVGLGRGSTEATATVRLIAFYRTIKTIQYTIARDYSKSVIDKITGKPGAVWIKFPPISEQDFLQMAQAIAALRTGMFPDAIAYAKWAQEKLGIPPNEEEAPEVPEEQSPPTQTPEQVKDFLLNQQKPA